MDVPVAIAAFAASAVAAVIVAVGLARQKRQAVLVDARAKAAARVRAARSEAQALIRSAENEAREKALAARDRDEDKRRAKLEKLAAKQTRLAALEAEVATERGANKDLRGELSERDKEIKKLRDRAICLRDEVADLRASEVAALGQRAGADPAEVAGRLERTWLEDARGEAAHLIRTVEQSAGDASYARRAQRLMEIAVSRYQNHFLTERNISNIHLAGEVSELLQKDDGRVLHALSEVANVKLNMAETGESLRLEGLDGVGREVARRALSRLHKKQKAMAQAVADPTDFATRIRDQLHREIQGLGKKAFAVLAIPKAHDEIVDLVGRLNYRTSYTQNQWLHAVEAAFLCGMIAEEMGLDVKLARRATLLHDIGKALTHEIEGSHAVIGADIARRLGEDEVVANAIGSHHADEPPNSVYAYLVAATDAMSGARPGARREHEGGYSTRLEDLERIARSYRGVDACFAVHGGRELRVYVRESEVSDLAAIEMSADIAAQVSEEMTFPGQIKVTIIRATEAVSVAN